MENEKKHNKVLEIILIILVSLSFVLIPLLNQYRQKSISLNHTQLVKRESDRNGRIDITSYGLGKVYTITSSFKDLTINTTPTFGYQDLLNGSSLTGSNDVFGYGFTNYFRFTSINFGGNNYFCLQYYVGLTNNNILLYNLGYYSAFEDSDDTGDLIVFNCLTRVQLENVGVTPTFNVLNFMYYNGLALDSFLNFSLDNKFGQLLSVQTDYKYPSNIFNYVFASNTKFFNIEQDFITGLIDSSTKVAYDNGYRDGYDKGVDSETGALSVFGLLQKASSAISSFLNIEVLPNLSLWLLISIPFSISLMVILLRLLRGGS